MTDDGSYYLYNRNWMYEREFDDEAFNIEFIRGLEEFLLFAISKSVHQKLDVLVRSAKMLFSKNQMM